MSIVKKILTEALTEDVYNDFMNWKPGKRRPNRPKPSSDADAQSQFMKVNIGDIVKVNDKISVIILSTPSFTPRSRNIECNVVELKNKDEALATGKGAAVRLTLRAVQSFQKLGKVTPKELQSLLGKKSELEKRVANKEKENHDAISYNHQSRSYDNNGYEVTMLDGNKAKVGDKVLVRFSNMIAPMIITRVAGSKNGEIMMIDPRKQNRPGAKSRGIPPNLIMKKVD